MEWSNDMVLRFLESYKKQACIWNPKHPHHKCRSRHEQAWLNIQHELKIFTVDDLKKKKKSLMASYRSLKSRLRKIENSDTKEIFEPCWFAFPLMDSFLDSVYQGQPRDNTTDNTITEDDDQVEFEVETLEEDNIVSDGGEFEYTTEDILLEPSTSQPRIITKKRKIRDPLESSTLSSSYQPQNLQYDDDECDLFGKLVAKKMRRFTEDQRDQMMIKILEMMNPDARF